MIATMRRSLPVVLVTLAGFAGGIPVASADCTCRSQGRDFELGQSTCLQTPKGARIATCGMVLNNTSWTFSDTPCVVSDASDAQPEAEPARAAAHDHAHHRHGG
jgi:hypothetical protein